MYMDSFTDILDTKRRLSIPKNPIKAVIGNGGLRTLNLEGQCRRVCHTCYIHVNGRGCHHHLSVLANRSFSLNYLVVDTSIVKYYALYGTIKKAAPVRYSVQAEDARQLSFVKR